MSGSYEPEPILTAGVSLSDDLLALGELLAKNAHDPTRHGLDILLRREGIHLRADEDGPGLALPAGQIGGQALRHVAVNRQHFIARIGRRPAHRAEGAAVETTPAQVERENVLVAGFRGGLQHRPLFLHGILRESEVTQFRVRL